MSIRLKKWATRGLKSGDLSTLSSIARGGRTVETERTERLSHRRFIAKASDGTVAVTALGRVALIVRRITLSS